MAETPTEAVAADHGSNLAKKLVAAAEEVTHVEKAGRNQQQNYEYATADDVARVVRTALLKRGVLIEMHVLGCHESAIQSNRGSAGLMVKAECELIVTDSDSGEQVKRQSIGYGADFPGDKAIYKARTGARKYALIELLGIPIGDDPENDKQPESAPAAKPQNGTRASENLATERQRALVFGSNGTPGLLEKANFDPEQERLIGVWGTVDVTGAGGTVKKLTGAAADLLIENLTDGSAEGRSKVLETVGWSDTPADTSDLG